MAIDPKITTEIKDTFEFYDRDGIGYQVRVGLNDAGRRIIVLFVRNANTRTWKPTLEMDIDLEAVYQDTATGVKPVTGDPPPPPPPTKE